MRMIPCIMKKVFVPAALFSLALLTACGSSRNHTPEPQVAMRYDTVTRAWVPVTTPTVLPATQAPHALAPEKASATAQIIETTAPAIPVQPGTDEPMEDKPGFLKKMGRAATSPLRAVGIGG